MTWMHLASGIGLLMLGQTAGSASTVWTNALKPTAPLGSEVTLARAGQTDYVIVIPDAPTTQDRKAAEDLSLWLREMTGAEFEIVSDATPARSCELCIGWTRRLADAYGADMLLPGMGAEGYAMLQKGDRLFFVGGSARGPINAVYALLEEDLGLRWYTPESTRIPKRPTVTFRPAPRHYTPQLRIRDPFYKAAFDGTWSLRNRTNAPSAPVPAEWGGNVSYALFVHTFHTLVPPDQYFAEHPEYFMMSADGTRNPHQLCTTNPETIRIATESALRVLREHPDDEIISVSKTDGGNSCVCPTCKALDDAEGSNAASLLYLVNRVAEAVQAEFPDVTVTTLAYLETVNPPKTVRPRENVAIRLCTDNCMWAHPFTPAREIEAFRDAMEGWGAIHDQIHIWDYCVNFSHYTAPMPNMDAIADNIRYFVAHNATGVMEQGAYQSVGAERDAMRSWVFAKLLWDPTLDERALERDFIVGYFGRASGPILEYNDLLRATGEEYAESLASPEGGIRYPMNSPFLSDEFLANAEALYDQAEALADTDELRARVERDRIPLMYVQLCRGPEYVGSGYSALIDRFERAGAAVGLEHIYEGPPDVAEKIAAWRQAVAK